MATSSWHSALTRPPPSDPQSDGLHRDGQYGFAITRQRAEGPWQRQRILRADSSKPSR